MWTPQHASLTSASLWMQLQPQEVGSQRCADCDCGIDFFGFQEALPSECTTAADIRVYYTEYTLRVRVPANCVQT